MHPATCFAIALSAIGLYIAAYFTLVYYGLISANTRLMPSVCRLEERTCQTVLGTRHARVFGAPNSLLGILYYLTVVAILLMVWTVPPSTGVLISVAELTALLVLYFASSLF